MKTKVLLVDDERDFRESTRLTLARRGYDVDTAGGGDEALKYLETTRPDLIILDLRMAEMDGITTLRNIRSSQGDIPVIILTGYGDFDSALSGIKLEIVDFLQKPVDIDYLAQRINHLLTVRRSIPLKEKTVSELMVPVDSYLGIYADEKVFSALKLLRDSMHTPVRGKVTETGHRSILVKNREENVVGLLRMVDILRMAAPEWMFDASYRSFFTGMFLAQCKVFGELVVGDFLNVEEFISITEKTPLIEASVLMAERRLINLPVLRDGRVVGILRDKDLFQEILDIILGE
jgi:DNA-binding response OmpR family regulator